MRRLLWKVGGLALVVLVLSGAALVVDGVAPLVTRYAEGTITRLVEATGPDVNPRVEFRYASGEGSDHFAPGDEYAFPEGAAVGRPVRLRVWRVLPVAGIARSAPADPFKVAIAAGGFAGSLVVGILVVCVDRSIRWTAPGERRPRRIVAPEVP